MKKKGFNPFILLEGTGGEGTIIGGGTGMGGDPGVLALSYTEWQNSGYQYGYDFDGDGTYSVEEYCAWWEDQGFSQELFESVNGFPWPGSANPIIEPFIEPSIEPIIEP